MSRTISDLARKILIVFLTLLTPVSAMAQDTVKSADGIQGDVATTGPTGWCGTKRVVKASRGGQPPDDRADCSDILTNPGFQYDPSIIKYLVPVVVHVMRRTDGVTGHVSEETVRSQIEVINEDFLALAGGPGEDGVNVNIEFYLANRDPDGNPTNGIVYYNNNTWSVDGGAYYFTLAWNPEVYLNIYTADLGGQLLGYGNQPQEENLGPVGSARDRVVLHYTSFGRDDPVHAGRVTTHEIGHYLGLYHPWHNGCSAVFPPNCYSTGDLICDTNPQESPTFGCGPIEASCGNLDPFENYMCYTNGICMTNFSLEQARRIRCTLTNWRSSLFQVGLAGSGACCVKNGSCLDGLTAGECASLGGTMLGNGTSCDGHPCPDPSGACCFGESSCVMRTVSDCDSLSGLFLGGGTNCHANPCPEPTAACCLGSGSCIQVASEFNCLQVGGSYLGSGSNCADMLDTDGDGMVDACDSDDDNDGYLDTIDDCPLNTPGLIVDDNGRPRVDLNGDCKVDGLDMPLVVEQLLN